MASTLTNAAYTHIRLGLLRGDYPPGAPLREVQLSTQLGVSRGPIREAFARLEDEGLVEQIPNRGAFARVPSMSEFADLVDTRIALEGVAVRKACARITRPQLARLRSILVRASRCTLQIARARTQAQREAIYTDWAITDIEFHHTIYLASHNPMLGRFLGRCHVLTRLWAHAAMLMKNRPAATVRAGTREHIRIYRAIKADQPRLADSLLTAHLEASRTSREQLGNVETCPALPEKIARAIVEMESNIDADPD